MQPAKVKYSIKYKLILLSVVVAVPFLVMVLYLLYALHNYSGAYDAIVGNLTVANSYNLNFKEEMDESLYKLVVGFVTFDTVGDDGSLVDPYEHLNRLRGEFGDLMSITTDIESRARLQILLRNINTLEDRVDDIRTNLETDVGYDVNIEMLDNNIYILTELIQDNIQSYIYYQTKSMEYLTNQLNVKVHSFTVFCGVLLVLLLFMVATLIVMFVTDIIRPIKELCGVTERVAEGDFSVRAEVETQDEVAVLADSVNLMTESLEGLVSKIKEDERKMRKADLRLLQEQINPHFLYNTLDTIVWLIEGNDSDKAVNMVMSLSEFFRLVLSKGKEYITIQEEELHIKSYLEIQQVRYRDILEYQISKFVGSYLVTLGGCDAIVFTAGIGENQPRHRSAVGKALGFMGVKLDEKLNEEMIHGKEGKISTPDSSIEVYDIPTNEELVIARDTKALVEKM